MINTYFIPLLNQRNISASSGPSEIIGETCMKWISIQIHLATASKLNNHFIDSSVCASCEWRLIDG
ncbi:MAG: hypothetical protein MK081_15140 [Flavobacteriales bacterium]|nr:hypothetical protein [Flavobacteriales bacterium]